MRLTLEQQGADTPSDGRVSNSDGDVIVSRSTLRRNDSIQFPAIARWIPSEI